MNRPGRWLPGLYEPSTKIIDRVRWEIGPDAAAAVSQSVLRLYEVPA